MLIALLVILALGVASLAASSKPLLVPLLLIGLALLFVF
jgi:hypothetical protein